MGTSPPQPVVARKTGTVPDCGRVRAAGDCPEFSAARKVFLSPDRKEGRLPKAKTPHEQESLKRTIAATDQQIDGLAYELYGLTKAEIAIVESQHS
jgi:hypothetical protein